MRKINYIIIGIVAILAVVAVVYFAGNSRTSPITSTDDVETVPVSSGPLSQIVGATGTVSSNQSATLNWKTSGVVNETFVQAGDNVQAGDVLAILDQSSLSPVDILAQADLVSAKRELDHLMDSDTQAARALQSVEAAEQALEEALNPDLSQANALQAIAEAEQAVEEADRKLKILTAPVSRDALDQAQANLVLAEKKLNDILDQIERIEKKKNKSEKQYKPWESRKLFNQILDGLELQRIQLQIAVENSRQKYENLKAPPNANDVAVAEGNLMSAQAQLLQAKRDWERIKNGASPAEIALLKARLADAQREWERLNNGAAPEDIAAAQARVAAAQAALDNAMIIAPFSGTITEAISKPNDRVNPGSPAFRLDDFSHLWVDVGISEIDINLVEVGQPVSLTFDAILAKQYNGKVVEVSPVGSPTHGVVDFKVTVEMTDADEDVRPGMTAAVEIIVNPVDEALLVPNLAVQSLKGKPKMYVLGGEGIPELIEIELGASSGNFSQVLNGGLNLGDQIIFKPSEM